MSQIKIYEKQISDLLRIKQDIQQMQKQRDDVRIVWQQTGKKVKELSLKISARQNELIEAIQP